MRTADSPGRAIFRGYPNGGIFTKRRILVICFGAALFLAALGLTLYPVISNYVNQKYASEIFIAYQEVISQTDNSVLVQEREKAVAYNQALVPGAESDNGYTQEALQSASEDYDSILNLSGDGIIFTFFAFKQIIPSMLMYFVGSFSAGASIIFALFTK